MLFKVEYIIIYNLYFPLIRQEEAEKNLSGYL